MSKIRVLVVDDSVVIRKILTEELSKDPGIEVVGTAPNGKIALMRIPQLHPNVITLDVEMPEMNGLDTLVEIRKSNPKLPVIMFSTQTVRGAETTIEALARGASDFVAKGSTSDSGQNARDTIREELITKIKALHGASSIAPPAPASAKPHPVVQPRGAGKIEALVVGVSTGGPNALAKLVPALPKDLPVPVAIVQHMPPMFTRLLAERLNAQSALQVVEAEHGAPFRPGSVYIAPGDYHMEIAKQGTEHIIQLHQGPPENSCRPAVDVLFRSVVPVFGGRTLAVVLTGMGYDGAVGSDAIKKAGGAVIAQDEASSVVWGMPGAVVQRGLADLVLPLGDIAGELTKRAFMGWGAGGQRVDRV